MSDLETNSQSARESIFSAIREERARQAAKFPDQEKACELFFGLAVLGEESGEANKAALDARDALTTGRYRLSHDAAIRKELLQTAAVAVWLIELIDRGNLYFHTPEDPEGSNIDRPAEPIATRHDAWCPECNAKMNPEPVGGHSCEHCGAVLSPS